MEALRKRRPLIAGGAPTIEELEGRQAEIVGRLQELDAEHAGERMADTPAGEEWNQLNEEHDRNAALIAELRARIDRISQVAEAREQTATEAPDAGFRTSRPGRVTGQDIYDLSTVRAQFADPAAQTSELRDRVLRSVEMSHFPHPVISDQDGVRSHVERLMHRFSDGEEFGSAALSDFCRRILTTGSAVYARAWSKRLFDRALTAEEQRALSLTGASGGFAVPYQLDPTIIPTSNFSVNPYRAIARVEQIMGDEWRGVTSGAITAAYAAEGTEASDNAPTLAQPTISAERAQAFVPFSIEIGQDWGAMQSEMAMLISDAKDDLEAVKFTTGGGTNEPFGVLTGLSTSVRVQTASTAAFVAGDVYKTEEALPPRFRPRAQWIANRFIYNKVRQFDTAGGSQLWVDNLRLGLPNQVPTPGNLGSTLIGYPAHEATSMGSALTSATKIAVLGDWRHFCIVERIGMNIEVIPHLFGASNRFPTGQRGLYAFWRNSSKVLAEAAFRYLETL